MKKYNLKKTNIVSNLLCLVICVIAMLPFMWMIATSLRLPVDSFRLPPSFFPTVFHYQNYVEVFQKVPLLYYIGNSFLVSGVATLVQCIVTCMASYAFARLSFKGKIRYLLYYCQDL